jgi:hypothetical protein
MNLFESISIFLALANLLIVLVGLIIALSQLRANFTILTHQHNWNKLKAAQDAAFMRNERIPLEKSKLLSQHFDYSIRHSSIPLDEILHKFETIQGLREALHTHLNYYESIARGVEFGLYDKELILATLAGQITRNNTRWHEYLEHKQKTSKKSWQYLKKLGVELSSQPE